MEINAKMIINIIIATVIALILAILLAFLTNGWHSFIIAVLISGAIIGLIVENIDDALVVGGVSGLLVSFLQGIIAPLILAPNVAALFPIFNSFIGFIIAGAISAGVVALVKDIMS